MNLQTTFEKFNQARGSKGPWNSIRLNGFKYFEQKGIPTKRDEDWKYTSLRQLTEETLIPVVGASVSVKNIKQSLQSYLNPEFLNLVFINGALNSELSNQKELAKIQVLALEDIDKTTVLDAIRTARKQVRNLRQDAMEALNAAFSHSGVVIEVPPHTSLGKPLQILHFTDAPGATYPKILVKIGKGSVLSLIETYVSENEKSLTDSMTEIVIENSAKLEYIRVQEEGTEKTHVGCSRIFLKEHSNLESLSYSTGGQVFRHNLDVYCMGAYCFAQVNGLTLGAKTQHHDNHTKIDHLVGNGTTTQLYKSILDDESKAVFNGAVYIHKDAQKASSEQLNNNLILSSKAEADTKPQLDVYADDVKATHGSTVGQLNPEELFYFLSRAIPKDKALEMLSLGFVKDLIDRVSTESIRTWLSAHLQKSYQQMKGKQP